MSEIFLVLSELRPLLLLYSISSNLNNVIRYTDSKECICQDIRDIYIAVDISNRDGVFGLVKTRVSKLYLFLGLRWKD